MFAFIGHLARAADESQVLACLPGIRVECYACVLYGARAGSLLARYRRPSIRRALIRRGPAAWASDACLRPPEYAHAWRSAFKWSTGGAPRLFRCVLAALSVAHSAFYDRLY